MWAQILEANEADEDEVERFVDAPAPDEAPVEVPGTDAEAAQQDADKSVQADEAAPAKGDSGGQRLLQGYDMAKRWAAASLPCIARANLQSLVTGVLLRHMSCCATKS